MDNAFPIGAAPRVLVADDSETIQKVVRIALARHPVKIETAASWQEAATKIQSGVALVMLDVNLPGVASELPAIKDVVAAAGKVPVVVMQGSHERSLGESALRECGVVQVIQKPFDSNELVATVTRLVASVAPPASASMAVPTSLPPPPPPVSQGSGAEMPFDISGLPPLPADLIDSSRKGKKAFDLDVDGLPSPDQLFPSSAPPPAATASMVPPPPPFAAMPASPAIIAAPDDQMAAQVRQAVEAYCAKHFRGLAIEVISAELRRLAEEKARHLVDI